MLEIGERMSEPRSEGGRLQEQGGEPAGTAWHVLWTHSHCEQQVYDQLSAKGFHLLLPRLAIWSHGAGGRRVSNAPMFPGYLFVHHALDKTSYVEIQKARGLVRILGERWDRPAVVPGDEIEAIQKLQETDRPAMPHPYLREGQRVRIVRGPLKDLEGILVRLNPVKGLLVVSIHLLQRSVAVEVDCTSVAPTGAASPRPGAENPLPHAWSALATFG